MPQGLSKTCDICGLECTRYVDGKPIYGPWANMCMPCFRKRGVGLGIGKGQEYAVFDNRWRQFKNGKMV